jgi:hypothetical protein
MDFFTFPQPASKKEKEAKKKETAGYDGNFLFLHQSPSLIPIRVGDWRDIPRSSEGSVAKRSE